jgi:protein phosphatase
MSVVLQCSGLSDRGKVRRLNEDQFLVAELAKAMRVSQTTLPDAESAAWSDAVVGHLLVVADGMGGVAGGEIASGLAVETVSWYVSRTMPWFYRYQDGREEELASELRVAVEACHRTVSDTAAASKFRKMGTTLTLAYVLWPRLYVVHVGDSRCYLHRKGAFHQMTRDHTLGQRAVEAGLMTPEQAEKSRMGHALWNCIGGSSSAAVTPDIYRATLEEGDELLLCTDGLTRSLTDEQIRMMLETADAPHDAVEALVAAANDAGGEDNITVIVASAVRKSTLSDTAVDGCAFLPAM